MFLLVLLLYDYKVLFYFKIANCFFLLGFDVFYRGSHLHITLLTMLNSALNQRNMIRYFSSVSHWGGELLGKSQQNFSYRISLEILWSCHFKEKEKQRQAELQEKKEIAEKKFKEWLENAKNKPRPVAKSYGYANGKLTGQCLCSVAYINMACRSEWYPFCFLLTEIGMCENHFFFQSTIFCNIV